jgi:hypothetical protein
MLNLTDGVIDWLKNTANNLKGSARRIFMAETVQQFAIRWCKYSSRKVVME